MGRNKRPQQVGLGPHDANLVVGDFDALGQRAQVIPPIAAPGEPDALTGGAGEFADHGGADRVVAGAVEHGLRALGVDPGLVADDLEAGDALLERRIVQTGDARLNGVVETLQAQLGFGRPPLQLGDVPAATLGLLLAAVEDGGEHVFEAVGIEQAFLDVRGDDAIKPVHGDRAALAAGLALTRAD